MALGLLLGGLAGNAISGAGSIIGESTGKWMGLGGNLLSGLFSGIGANKRMKKAMEFQREMMEEQYQNELEKMGIQADYNKKQAKYSSDLQKEMWDYTNYENQVKHLEAAGLNTGLLYGQSGGGGVSTGSANAAGVSQGESASVAMGLQARGLMAEIEKTEAEANLAQAEAAKTAGIDTLKGASEMKVNESLEQLNKINSKLGALKGTLTMKDIDNAEQQFKIMGEQLRILSTDADIKESTKESAINKAFQEVINMGIQGALWDTQGKLNEQQIHESKKRMEVMEQEMSGFWYKLITGRISADAMKDQAKAAADRVVNENEYWKKLAELKGKEVVTGYVRTAFYGLGQIANTINVISDFIPTKSFFKMANRGFDTFSETIKKKGW